MFPKMIAKASDGRLIIKLYHAGQLIPTSKIIDAVGDGKVEVGYGGPIFWAEKVPALTFFTVMPFGMTAQEQNAWLEYGGGRELADRIYSELGCKFFPAGNSGAQMGGWFNKEIESISDL
jgi:TRAP-type mannitol/chloroaromatic compound transport system substrate-binding protein